MNFNYCVLPADCLTGSNCTAAKKACAYYKGYVKSALSDECVIPTKVDCADFVSYSFTCRPGNAYCVYYGYVFVTGTNG